MTIGFSNIVHEWSFFNVGVEEFLVHILTPFLIALLMISSPEKEVNDFFIVNIRLKSPAGGCEASDLRGIGRSPRRRQEGQ